MLTDHILIRSQPIYLGDVCVHFGYEGVLADILHIHCIAIVGFVRYYWHCSVRHLYVPTAADMCPSVVCVTCACIVPVPVPCTAPVPHPAPLMTEAHPMAKQRPMEPSDGQSKPLFSSLYQLCNLGQCSLMKQLFMC